MLVSWLARENDPYESKPTASGERNPGPTLTLLTDRHSAWRGEVGDVVLFWRDSDVERRKLAEVRKEISERAPGISVRDFRWDHDDPTDHRAIFEFLRRKLPEVRRTYAGRELVVHVSPGTPSMHTVWVLLGECGFIEAPFQLVKSYRAGDRPTGTARVVPVEVGIETFFKVYQQRDFPVPRTRSGSR